MISSREQPRAVERPQVGDFLDHAQRFVVPARIGADGARVGGVDIAADRADRELVCHILKRGEQRLERRFAPLHQMQHRAARRTGPEPRQARKGLRQRFDLL